MKKYETAMMEVLMFGTEDQPAHSLYIYALQPFLLSLPVFLDAPSSKPHYVALLSLPLRPFSLECYCGG